MPLPKRKHSKSRGRKRRTHYKLSPIFLDKCPKCEAAKLAHRVCLTCGFYNDKPVLQIKTKKEKQ
ncbi:MAG: 50S ribosomal protein L32 [bacterium]